jgi:branched-subunit amino acid transport protein
MPWNDYLIILSLCVASMLACRVIPALLLKDRKLPAWLELGLGYIPPAAFAALIAADLFSPTFFDALSLTTADTSASDLSAFWPTAIVWLASAVVVIVAIRTKSLIGCIVTGVSVYAILLFVPHFF